MGEEIFGLTEYKNVPKTIGTVVSSGLASLTELTTTLGLEDLWVLLEINSVDSYNKHTVDRHYANKN